MDYDRKRRLEEALLAAERVGNVYLAASIKLALKKLVGMSEGV